MAQQSDSTSTSRIYRGPVRRLRIEVTRDGWRLTRSTQVERKSIPASWEPPPWEARTASCIEAVDAQGAVLHRQAVHAPTDTSMEVFDGPRLQRHEAAGPRIIDVVIPDLAAIADVRLISAGQTVPRREAGKDDAPLEAGE